MKTRNNTRARSMELRNFGAEAEAVRAMESCVCARAGLAPGRGRVGDALQCSWPVVPAHVIARGLGGAHGGRFDIVDMCDGHHDEQHRVGVRTFAERYSIDLRALADAVAVGHERPLGIKGLADRWVQEHTMPSGQLIKDVFEGYDRDALLGWVRREMERQVKAFAADEGRAAPSDDHKALAGHVLFELQGQLAADPGGPWGIVWELCEEAGWPS